MTHHLPWLQPTQEFPPIDTTWGDQDPIPGLLAAGSTLDAAHLRLAYSKGIFPWFSEGQPVLWWSPNPRMVLHPPEFRLRRSLRKTLQKFSSSPECEIRIDSAFSTVMQHCAQTPREGQHGTWIVQSIIDAYSELHFIDTLWPDVDANVLADALAEFARRERRYGLTSAQLDAPAHVDCA